VKKAILHAETGVGKRILGALLDAFSGCVFLIGIHWTTGLACLLFLVPKVLKAVIGIA